MPSPYTNRNLLEPVGEWLDPAAMAAQFRAMVETSVRSRVKAYAEKWNVTPLLISLMEAHADPEDAALFKMFWADRGSNGGEA